MKNLTLTNEEERALFVVLDEYIEYKGKQIDESIRQTAIRAKARSTVEELSTAIGDISEEQVLINYVCDIRRRLTNG